MVPTLAHCAIPYNKTTGREHTEPGDPTRTPYQRDRDRIIHAKAFRRLSGKTQVFTAKHTDHIRDRLTHSLEVAQVARDMARTLGLNEDLCEAIGLAHDLGHTPFGHAGQDALNEEMQRFGLSFEHNQQSKRIVEILEHPFPHFPGLNLTFEVLEGLAKHQTLYDQKTQQMRGKTLEAQIVDKADEIAYHTHDIDDGLRLGLFTLKELCRLSLVARAVERVEAQYSVAAAEAPQRIVSSCMNLMMSDLTLHSLTEVTKRGLGSVDDVLVQKTDCIVFSPEVEAELVQLRAFLWERMYQSHDVQRMSQHGQNIIKMLFHHYCENPTRLPENHRIKIDAPDSLPIVVKDYIAGMTDWFATEELTKIS